MKKVLSLILVMVVCCGMFGVGEAWSWRDVPLDFVLTPLVQQTDAYMVYLNRPEFSAAFLLVDILEQFPKLEVSFKEKDSVPAVLMYNIASPDQITYLYLRDSGNYMAAILEIKKDKVGCVVDPFTEVKPETILKNVDDPYIKLYACAQEDIQSTIEYAAMSWSGTDVTKSSWWERLKPDEWTYDRFAE